MKMTTCYGREEIPQLKISRGKEKCPFCKEKHKKGDATVYIAVNRGPVGRVFYCAKHAKQLAKDILKLFEDLNACTTGVDMQEDP